ncbi:MAG: methyltransferase domain-containing protein [Pseudomonadota bacterium]
MPDREDCLFFHVLDLPGGEVTDGAWDFRATESEYHGGFDFRGKRVLEIGCATGSHSFWMESQGARVTPYDLAPDYSWDLMPTHQQDPGETRAAMVEIIRKLNNGFDYCRDRLGSGLAMTHGSIYAIDPGLGDFDVVTFGSVLLHTRDPLGALQAAVSRAGTIIIMDRWPPNLDCDKPLMQFIPELANAKPWGGWTWWWISPKVFENFLRIHGFTRFQLTVSEHLYVPTGNRLKLFTLIAER